MEIALFTNGSKSIIGMEDNRSHVIDSILLFQDPSLFPDRLISLMKTHLGINNFTAVTEVIIALPAPIDTANNRIKKSPLLNDLSRVRKYDGFDFNKALTNYFPKENIFVLNDAFAVALGVSRHIGKEQLPCLVLAVNDGIGVSFINEANSIMTTEWGGDFVKSIGKNIYDALGRDSIINLLRLRQTDINLGYTEYLSHAIEHLVQKYNQDNPPIKSVYILGEKTQYINEVQLKARLENLYITVATDETLRKEIILNGCFSYPEYLGNRNNGITKIQYFSGEELIYDFDDFAKCVQHFISVKPICNQENYYKILYSNGSVKIVKMKELDNVEMLEEYKF